jgi:signal-transduction protein with cAMP-binding, CBS, and nucleotidyltransferase domain
VLRAASRSRFNGRRKETDAVAEKIGSILDNKENRIWSMGPDETVYDAIALMADKGIGALLVLSEGELVGIISERDYARKIILHGRSSKDTLVGEIMTTSPMTVTPEHTVDECMRIMTQHRVRHLPVLDEDELVGVISIGDLVNAIIEAQAHTIHQLHTYITGTYPA